MIVRTMIGITVCFVAASAFDDGSGLDPVLKAKSQRALANAHDLPPVPRGLMEPPPLPPPEMHAYDIRKKRAAPVARKKAPAKKQATAAKKPAANAKAPATNTKAPAAAAKKPATNAKAPASAAKK